MALKERLEAFGGLTEGNDSVVWSSNTDMEFLVALCYGSYESLCIPFDPPNKYEEVFKFVCKMDVPFKMKAFGWRLFHNRFLTNDLLVIRGISLPLDNLKCIFCGSCLENRKHFF